MRGLLMELMSGGNPETNTNIPIKILALRLRAVFWPTVNSASLGIPASISRLTRLHQQIAEFRSLDFKVAHYPRLRSFQHGGRTA